MKLFRKKTALPEGPARMSVAPSASKEACTAEKHLAEIEEALTRYAETMESTYRAAVRSQIIQAEQRLARISPKRTSKRERTIVKHPEMTE